jgi:uncharacterized protein YjdB
MNDPEHVEEQAIPMIDDPLHPVVHVSSASLDKTTLTMSQGSTAVLTAAVLPENASDPSVTWTSDDTDVVTVDENGKVTAVGLGSAVITVSVGGDGVYAFNSTTVVVIVREKLTISASADPIFVGEDATVIITGLKNATGNVSVRVGNSVYFGAIVNGIAKVVVPALSESVMGYVDYQGDEYYVSTSTTVQITVNKIR